MSLERCKLCALLYSNSVTACVGTFLTLGTQAIDLVKHFLRENQDLIELAKGSLRTGDGAIKITLTWDNSSDLDLYVVDPNGDQVSYVNPRVSSGGYLDVDGFDRIIYTGSR